MEEPKKLQTIESMVLEKSDKIKEVAVESVRQNFDQWTKRAIIEVSQNKELREFIQSSQDTKNQFFVKLAKAAQIGLQIGGTRPHVYFINMKGSLRMDITKDGFAHSCVHGPQGVLQNVPELIKVYEKDKFSINQAKGTYEHEFSPFGDRGKLLGYFMVLNYRDGHTEIPHIGYEKVVKIKNNFSNVDSPAWKKSEDEMLEKIAVKQLLKKPFAESEGLAMLMTSEDEIHEEQKQEIRIEKTISERAVSRLENASKSMPPIEIQGEIQEQKEEEPSKKLF
jgi:recombinational DNA repair protein RecT